MQGKLSDLIDNLSEINKKECKVCMEGKKIKSECDFIGFKNNRLNFSNMNQFCNGDINKFALLLRQGVYPYECMDSWERLDEKSAPFFLVAKSLGSWFN